MARSPPGSAVTLGSPADAGDWLTLSGGDHGPVGVVRWRSTIWAPLPRASALTRAMPQFGSAATRGPGPLSVPNVNGVDGRTIGGSQPRARTWAVNFIASPNGWMPRSARF